jgi:hypothetical protein
VRYMLEEYVPAKGIRDRPILALIIRDSCMVTPPQCRRCNLPIEKQAVSSSDGQLKGKYHRDCFNCHTCHVSSLCPFLGRRLTSRPDAETVP